MANELSCITNVPQLSLPSGEQDFCRPPVSLLSSKPPPQHEGLSPVSFGFFRKEKDLVGRRRRYENEAIE
jgi:hypothetical protein